MKRVVFLLVLLLVAAPAFSQEAVTVRDIGYSTVNEYAAERCKLDVYTPSGAKDAPVVVWFHGGGLMGGGKFIPPELKDEGIVVVAANYRLLPGASIDEVIDDAAAAVAWTFNNIGNYGGSPDRIYVAGHSAGGYLTNMIGLDKTWLSRYGIDADRIAGLAPYSGQVITHFALRESMGMSPLQPLVDKYAPLYHVRPDAPPIIIISGDRELELYGRYEETAYFWRMLKLSGHPAVYLYELDGYDHGSMASPAHHILKNHIRRGR